MRIKKTNISVFLVSLCFAVLLLQAKLLYAEPQALSFPSSAAAKSKSSLAGSGLLTSPVGVKQERGVISLGSKGADKTAQLYLFHNTSDIPLWLKRTNYDQSKGMQAGWDVLLAGDSYSVLMLNRKSMDFACDLANTDLPAIVDCKDYVVAARIAKQNNTFSQANIGNFWAVESWSRNTSHGDAKDGADQSSLKQVLAARKIFVK